MWRMVMHATNNKYRSVLGRCNMYNVLRNKRKRSIYACQMLFCCHCGPFVIIPIRGNNCRLFILFHSVYLPVCQSISQHCQEDSQFRVAQTEKRKLLNIKHQDRRLNRIRKGKHRVYVKRKLAIYAWMGILGRFFLTWISINPCMEKLLHPL